MGKPHKKLGVPDDPQFQSFADVRLCDARHFGELVQADVIDLLVEAVGLPDYGHHDWPLACRPSGAHQCLGKLVGQFDVAVFECGGGVQGHRHTVRGKLASRRSRAACARCSAFASLRWSLLRRRDSSFAWAAVVQSQTTCGTSQPGTFLCLLPP